MTIPARMLAENNLHLTIARDKYEAAKREADIIENASVALDKAGIQWDLVDTVHPYFAYGEAAVRFVPIKDEAALGKVLSWISTRLVPAVLAEGRGTSFKPETGLAEGDRVVSPVLPAIFQAGPGYPSQSDASYSVKAFISVDGMDMEAVVPVSEGLAGKRFMTIFPETATGGTRKSPARVVDTRTSLAAVCFDGPAAAKVLKYDRMGQDRKTHDCVLYWATKETDIAMFPSFA